MVAGELCRGCGRGFWGAPDWEPVLQRTPEEQAAFAAEEAAFHGLHPDCPPPVWSFAGGGLTHCGVCCPPPPLGPEQERRIATIIAEAAMAAMARDADLERQWEAAASTG